MPFCEACGAELLPNARFCGRCGQPRTVTGEQTTISKSPQLGTPSQDSSPIPPVSPALPAPIVQGNPPNSLPGQNEEEEEEEERRNAVLPFIVPQQSAPSVPMVQGIPQITGVPTAQGMPPTMGGLPHVANLAQNVSPSASLPNALSSVPSSVPSSPTPLSFVSPQNPSVTPVEPHPPFHQSGSPEPPAEHHHRREHHEPHHKHHRTPSGKLRSAGKGLLGTIPKWVLILIIAMIVAAGGGGVLAAMLHNSFSQSGGSSNLSSSLDHTGTPTGKTKGKGVIVGATSTPTPSPCASNGTPVATGGGGTNLFFVGPFPCSPMTAITYNSCQVSTLTSTGESYYSFIVKGTIDGTQYEVSLEVNVNAGSKGYTGPGTYTSNIGTAFHVVGKPISAPWIWGGGTGTSGTTIITINGGENSGVVYSVMPTTGWSGKTVTMTGNWTCGNLTHTSSP